jgi:CheY-like chemotaxis protein
MARILVVDDDSDMRMGLMWTMQDLDHEVFLHESGQSVLELFKVGYYDLVITDQDMPGMQGHELVEKLRELEPGLKIILQSGGNEPKNHQADVFRDKGSGVPFLKGLVTGLLAQPKRKEGT